MRHKRQKIGHLKGLVLGVWGVLVLGLTGCTTQTLVPSNATFWLAPGVKASLPHVACPSDYRQQTLLTAKRESATQRVMTAEVCRAGLYTMDVLTPTGMALMTVTYDGVTLTSTSHVPLPQGLEASQMVADVLLATLPVTHWANVLPNGYHLEDTPNGRQVLDPNGQVVETFIYHQGQTPARLKAIEHHAFGYTLTFRPL